MCDQNKLANHLDICNMYFRSLTGNFACFIKGIGTILSQFSKPNIEIIICGDVNINYPDENCYKH